jgi:hypothetical protein
LTLPPAIPSRLELIDLLRSSFFFVLFRFSKSSEFCFGVTPQGGIQLPPGCPHPETAPIAEFADYARSRIAPLLTPAAPAGTNSAASASAQTWVFPTVQMGRFGIHHDERVTELVLSSCTASGATLDLASAYFNITKRYKAAILSPHNQAQVNIITASPEVPQPTNHPSIHPMPHSLIQW